MRYLKALAATSAMCLAPPVAIAQAPATGTTATNAPTLGAADAAAAFGARENLQGISLSPDGNKVALIVAGPGRSAMLMVGDLVAGGPPKLLTRVSGDPEELVGCDWPSATRLICSLRIRQNLDGRDISFGRLFAINADGTDLKVVSARTSWRALDIMQHGGALIDWGDDAASGSALVTRQFVPEYSTGTRMAEQRQGLGVELIDTRTLSRRVIEQPREEAVNYISDGHGGVRVMATQPGNATG